MRAHIIERLITSPCPPNLALLLHVTGDSITPEAERAARMAHAVYRYRKIDAAYKRLPPNPPGLSLDASGGPGPSETA